MKQQPKTSHSTLFSDTAPEISWPPLTTGKLVRRCKRFLADAIDPAYGHALRQAVGQGLELLVYDVDIDLTGIRIRRRLPICLERTAI